jgi:LacI family transcriptional regulator
MQDVAAMAGVSKTTVSHVINQTRVVDKATRQRVLAAIEALDYHPNLLARSLTTNKTSAIGVIIADSANFFFGEMIRGICEVLLPEHYGLVVCPTQEILEREAAYLELLVSQRVDGIIAAATSQAWPELYKADAQHTPIVLVDRRFEGMDWPFVGVDNQGGACLGVSHLIACGHRSIGLLSGYDRLSTMVERQVGYCQAMRAAGLPVREDWIVPSMLSVEEGRRAMHQLLSAGERPRAVFASNNVLVLGALMALRECRLRCPDDVAVACFDDHPWSTVADPPLTVVRQPVRQLGRRAAQTILALIRDEPIQGAAVALDCELVVRQSSGAPR